MNSSIGRGARALLLSFAAPLFLLTAVGTAQAQGVALEQFQLAETADDGFAVSRPNDFGPLNFGFQLALSYANDPLVFERVSGDRDSEEGAIVAHHLVGHANIALGLVDRLVLFAGIPVSLVMEGDDDLSGTPEPDGTAIGDLSLGARLRLVGERTSIFGLALQASMSAPLADAAKDGQLFAGSDSFTFHPELLFELRPGPLRITANVGARIMKEIQLQNLRAGNELTYALGLSLDVLPRRLSLHGEIFGSSTFDDFGDRVSSPLEGLLGLKYRSQGGLGFGVAGGTGFTRGYGSPDFRAIATFGLGLPDPEAPPPPPPDEPQAPGDRDHDGLLDPDDGCPDQPEDIDTFQDEDGCPDTDNDNDTIPDASDECPMDPEDMDGYEDTNGCPEPDNDGDQIPDGNDQCPNEPEDVDTFEDTNGCPDVDNDQDTVLDPDDECPLSPGTPEAHGCPRTVRVETETGRIIILERVEFATNRDVILARSEPVLEDVRSTVAANPQLVRIRIEGHTDDRGPDPRNMTLSVRRAGSVVRWLIEHGIDPSRLEGYGCGEARPLDNNRTAQGRQANRRVEFRIVDPAPLADAPTTEGCTQYQPE